MAIAAGSRLGPYEIVASIGAGGMGEVFRARDTRLQRDVAVKVLPSASALDPERLRRFEQEARATAALNHPNILAVYDVGAENGISFVVSELLDGETLRDRLSSGPLPARKAAEYAAQIARGLAAAHERGIVHRDLKPENLFLTRDGRVKILDFGIAKLTAPPSDLTIAPTIEQGTTPGVVLGTVGYMSPEQVRGQPTDHRTDIFSFGAILYEMLTGRRAFAGATSADTMSAILTADPPELDDAQRAIPPMLDRLARRCLEKSPDERFQSARDLAFDLDAVSTASHTSGGAAALDAASPRKRSPPVPLILALAAGLALGAGLAWTLASRARTPDGPSQYRQLTFRRGTIGAARFGPDGETVVYSAAWEGREVELFTTHAGSIGEQALGTAGELLSVSSKGELAILREPRTVQNWIQLGTLARSPLGGGAPRDVLRDVSGADWSPDGQSLAVTRFVAAENAWRLEYPMGTTVLQTPQWIERPRVSRDGKRIVVLEHPPSGDDRGDVLMVSLKGESTRLTPEFASVKSVAWGTPADEVWFTASNTGTQQHLYAVRPGSAVRTIAPMPVSVLLEDVLPDGRLLMQTGTMKVRTLVKTPADKDERDFGWLDYGLLRDMSADGSTVLFDEEGEGGGPNYSVFVRKTDGSPAVRLGEGYAERLSPDLQWVTTATPGDFGKSVTLVPIGPGEARKLALPAGTVPGFPGWFPDGKRLAVVANGPGKQPQTVEYTIETGKVRPITPEGTFGVLVSPDGGSLLVGNREGRRATFPLNGGAPHELTTLGPHDTVIRWAGDGRSLFISTAVSARQLTISQLTIADGARRPIVTVSPSDAAGLRALAQPVISADGRTYAYRYLQILSDLFVGERR